ncbi:MAG: hypothetical protein EKK52_13770 [Burkholderiales bacterium]|nr:MAG: hypothetical protein EKK52_13770 [Burkholderiales bacterium]
MFQRCTSGLRWVLLGTLLVQGVLQAIFFAGTSVLDATPLVHIDAPYHAYQMEVARQLCSEREIQGWDPFFGGGQPAGVVGNASAKVQGLFACLDGQPSAIWPTYKASSFVFGLLGPATLVVACMLIGLSVRATVLASVLGVLMWWTGGLRWYHTAGLVSYVAMAYALIPFVIAVKRLVAAPGPVAALAVGLFAAAGFWLHPLFPVAAVLLGLPLLIVGLRDIRQPLAATGCVVAVTVLMVAVNWAWVAPTLTEKSGISNGLLYQAGVNVWLPLQEMLGRAGTAAGGTRMAIGLLVGAGLVLALRRVPHRLELVGLMLGSAVLMIWASVGAVSPGIARLQPNRFSTLAWLVLVVPAAGGLDAALSTWRHAARGLRLVLGLSLCTVALFAAFFCREVWREFTLPDGGPRYGVAPPEVKGDGEVLRRLELFLKEHTDRSARVYFENSLGRIHDGAHIAGLLAMRADRELIGGAYPGVDFANAWDDTAFGQPLSRFTPEALVQRLDDYNIRWMLCHREACRHAMQSVPGVSRVAELGPVTAFERTTAPGWVLEGQARVTARCHNRLELDDISGDRLVLRYHWVPGLRSVEGAVLRPVELVPGARPFVAIDHPPARLTLRRGAGDGLPCASRSPASL